MTHRTGTWEPTVGAVLVGEGLHAGYPGRGDVLDCAHVSVTGRSRLALLGENGSGKTTLLRCLSGAHVPDAGSVAVDGITLRHDNAGLRDHRQRVQLVLQDPDDQLFSADVRADVSFGPINLGLDDHEVRARVSEALELLDVVHLADRPVHQLSYGQRKRVAIAGALAMQPCVMLLDEPTAGLGPQGVDEMVGALESLLRAHTTVVISTHDVEFALGWADSVAVLVDGRVRHGAPNALLSDAGLVAAARLRQPLVLQAAALLGLDAARVTDVTGLVAAIRDQGRLAEGVA